MFGGGHALASRPLMQSGEILIILLLALIVLGPQRLPDIARRLGRWTQELRTAAREITRGLEAEVDDIRAVGRELRGPIEEAKKSFTDVQDDFKNDMKDLESGLEWKGPKPISGPTPADAMEDLKRMEGAESSQDDIPTNASDSDQDQSDGTGDELDE